VPDVTPGPRRLTADDLVAILCVAAIVAVTLIVVLSL
jgi:hypothetical protein